MLSLSRRPDSLLDCTTRNQFESSQASKQPATIRYKMLTQQRLKIAKNYKFKANIPPANSAAQRRESRTASQSGHGNKETAKPAHRVSQSRHEHTGSSTQSQGSNNAPLTKKDVRHKKTLPPHSISIVKRAAPLNLLLSHRLSHGPVFKAALREARTDPLLKLQEQQRWSLLGTTHRRPDGNAVRGGSEWLTCVVGLGRRENKGRLHRANPR